MSEKMFENWKSFKNDKNVFHLQCFSCSDIWIFVLNFRSCQKTGLIRKIRLISKFMIPQPVNKYFQHTYLPMSQEVKTIRQLIQRNLRNIVFLKIIHKMRWRCYSQTFFKKIKIAHMSRLIFISFIQLVFMVCQVEDYQNILKISCRPLAFTSHNT